MSKKTTYIIKIKTESQYKEAGTDATVSIQLVGSEKETEWRKLDHFWWDDFEHGRVDEFSVEAEDVGRPILVRLRIEHHSTNKDIWAGEEITVQTGSYVDYFPLHDWVENYVEVGRCNALLPQHLSNDFLRRQRKNEILKNKSFYQWSEKTKDVLPRHIKIDNYNELPMIFKQDDVKNRTVDDFKSATKKLGIIELIQEKFKKLNDLDDFKHLFSYYKVPGDLPPYILKWDQDEEVGRQMLNGVNPCSIQMCRKIPEGCFITSKMVEKYLERKSLENAMNEGRIYMIDHFKTYYGLERHLTSEGMQLFTPDALCLFYSRSDGKLVPIAIQLEPFKDETIFTPSSEKNDWMLAKMYFRSIDALYHESLITSHLSHNETIDNAALFLMNAIIKRDQPLKQSQDLFLPFYNECWRCGDEAVGGIIFSLQTDRLKTEFDPHRHVVVKEKNFVVIL